MELGKSEAIADNLRSRILNGELAAGKKLGSERELAVMLKASRETVRQALKILESEGVISRSSGKGTFIAGTRERVTVDKGREILPNSEGLSISASELQKSGSFLRDMERMGRRPQVQFLEQPSLVAVNIEIAKQLQVQNGTLVFKRYRLQSADNLPYRIIESYYPSDLFGGLLTTNIGDKPLFEWLQEEHNLKATHVHEKLLARLATQSERQLLHISQTAPIVAIDRTVLANTGRPIEWANIIAVAALYEFTYEYDILEWNKEAKANVRKQPN